MWAADTPLSVLVLGGIEVSEWRCANFVLERALAETTLLFSIMLMLTPDE